ncbi:hypothetical protein BGY98DRAFT_1178355 [Russula aff. rugulosa BPL654]|nr:hypothetical protein BGY98DRAFT_1178355 [Russula aff. rugulosa BPL654]
MPARAQRCVPVPTACSLPPPSAIDIVSEFSPPLHSSFDLDRNTDETQSEGGSDNDNDADRLLTLMPHGGRRSHSPNPTRVQLCLTHLFLHQQWGQRRLPTNELELEQQAECDRERSRHAMSNISYTATPLPCAVLPRARTPCPDREPLPLPARQRGPHVGNAAKNRLTPTKEPLITAQQVNQETKEKEKREKEFKKVEKERKSSADWPAVPENKFNNPRQRARSSLLRRLLRLGLKTFHQFSLLVWHRAVCSDNHNGSPPRSPSREPPPLYTRFTDQGSLDVPGTLLVIAWRSEKLEKWTVGHVLASGERMSDVERRPVEKENDKGGDPGEGTSKVNELSSLEGTVNEMRDDLVEIQGYIGELGREMAKFATSPDELLNNRPLPFSPSNTPQASLPMATSADANRSAHHLPLRPRSAPNGHDHVCRTQRETTHLPQAS